MSHTHKRGWLRRINPVRRFKRAHRGEANPIWVMTATAPFEVPIVTYFAVLGWWVLVAGYTATPGSITATLPLWLIYCWSACFALGGTMALAGRYFQRFPVESSGLALLGAAFFTYASALIYVVGSNAVFASGAYVALLSGCLFRIRVIVLDRKAHRVATQFLYEEQNGDAPR
jgi:hypothetical protein